MIQGHPEIEWRVSPGQMPYETALAEMEARAAAIRDGTARELIWLLEHPPLYTAGTSASPAELLEPERFPVFVAGRGGKYTYHGPGQRIVYILLDLEKRGKDVRRFVHSVESWVIDVLDHFGIASFRAAGRVGIWTTQGGQEAKIGAIGVRVRRWVSFHGLALNVHPDLSHFGGIVPCGLPEYAVTSMAELGLDPGIEPVDRAFAATAPNFLARLEQPCGCA
jgi:lipoyl(octanoyl) transferase